MIIDFFCNFEDCLIINSNLTNMISFGSLNNNIAKLKKYLTKMGLFKGDKPIISVKDLD